MMSAINSQQTCKHKFVSYKSAVNIQKPNTQNFHAVVMCRDDTCGGKFFCGKFFICVFLSLFQILKCIRRQCIS